jgi:predicted CXXCH cytochrome family protein
MKQLYVLFSLVMLLAANQALAQQGKSIEYSKHNLSASGPGSIRASAEQEVCIFCHTPHNASPIQPMWNRNNPVSAYVVYSSQSLDATPGQPTGSSKLCLSCHDGSIAVGSVLSRDQEISMAGGIHTLPAGRSNLGTDLSDDHPVSFRYDTALASKDLKLKDPAQLPLQVKLDKAGELQCTSCHDAHDDSNGAFLVMDNSTSQLCASCHRISDTTVTNHVNCNSCHVSHSSPSGPYLLTGTNLSDTCLKCHSGQTGPTQGANILTDLNKLDRHNNPPPRGQMSGSGNYISCNDCHEPHTMKSATAVAPTISPKLGKVSGINTSGAAVIAAQYEYEVCFKCHANTPVTNPVITRRIVQNNTRLEFAPTAVSYHPVEAPGKNLNVPSLRPPLTTASMIYCTDCHASDTSKKAGSSGANGPHGSNVSPLLIARYDTLDRTSESASAYALCYKCHDRTKILSESGPFKYHRKHIVEYRTPCSICHDPHGISSTQGNVTNNSKLINFDTTAVTAVNGVLQFRSTGTNHGTCTLKCHGETHSNESY